MKYALIEGNYEVVRATCPHCGVVNVWNRASDFGDCSPIAFREVVCTAPACGVAFAINGDRVGPAYQMFYYEGHHFAATKRYSFAILSVAQALEVFFSHAVCERWLLKQFSAEHRNPAELAELNAGLEVLHEKTKKFAYRDMRNLFLDAALQPQPRTVAEGRALVDAIQKKPPAPTDEDIAAAPPGLSVLLQRLKDCAVNEMRNEIAHKRAYRPTHEEAREAIETVGNLLFPLARQLSVEFDSF